MAFSQAEELAAFNRAPKIIQDALEDGPIIDFIVNIPSRYGLHIDVAGKVGRVISNMLLGLIRPDEVPKALADAYVSTDIAKNLIEDMNRDIFIPLRNRVRNNGVAEEETVPTRITQTPPPEVEARTVEIPVEPIKIPAPVPDFNLIRPDVLVPAQPIDMVQPAAQIREIRTMEHDAQMAQQGAAGIQSSSDARQQIPFNPQPEHATPSQTFQTASIPYPMQPVRGTYIPPALEQKPLQIPVKPSPSSSQAGDPYREPI